MPPLRPQCFRGTSQLLKPMQTTSRIPSATPLPRHILSRPQFRACLEHRPHHRCYYTESAPTDPPFPPTESAILAAAIRHVPHHGFTNQALMQGAVDAGYLPASTNLFPRGAYDLVFYHLVTSRLAIKDSVQFPEPDQESGGKPMPIDGKIRSLLISRLKANEPMIHKLHEAFALMSLPTNVPPSLRELALLVDEVLYLAGDTDVSASWYTKRAALAGVYASSELFMTQDQSAGFRDTELFVDRRLEESEKMSYALHSTGEWLSFTGLGAINVLRSWGARI